MAFPSLINATCDDIRLALDNGLFTSMDLVRAYLKRIEEVNGKLRAVTEVNPDAVDIAGVLDEERKRGFIRGPLHGIPILLKNNIATADNLNTTAGSSLLIGARVPHDSTTASRLRAAGAIILGKTNLSQWANYRSSNAPNGWSADCGQTLAAYHVNQDPGGSSSGSGVAVDLGLAPVAIGTETDGSIVSPAAQNGVVGIKPTVGLTSRYLVIPLSEHLDSVGPMAKTVRDAALVLQVLAGEDENDGYTGDIPRVPDYVAACKDGCLKGARLGVPFHLLNQEKDLSDAQIQVFKTTTLDILIQCGATIIDITLNGDKSTLRKAEFQIFAADFKTGLASYLSQLVHNPHGMRTLDDLVTLTQDHTEEAYPERNTHLWEEALSQTWDTSHAEFNTVYAKLLDIGRRGLLNALEEHNLDAVVLPTRRAPKWAAVAGAPIITVPMGFHPATTEVKMDCGLVDVGPGIPFGLSFLGAKWDEERLIGLAYGFERASLVRARNVTRVVEPQAEVMRVNNGGKVA